MINAWRNVATPYGEVLRGTIDQSSFAANLSMVAFDRKEAGEEYLDAERFFARTYLTKSMKDLLVLVAKRLRGMRGSQPIIDLQTNFGGGKTHTLLAVFHMAKRKASLTKLRGVYTLLNSEGIQDLPVAKVAVIDGISLSPNEVKRVGRLEIRTLWGQIAYQLGGIDAYNKVRNSDEGGTSPGKDIFAQILRDAGPCVILMDELVAYFRQLIQVRDTPLGGSYAANISFMQVLAESVKEAPEAQLLISMPESTAQLGGEDGLKAKNGLEHVLGRMEFTWRAGEASDGYEIVKRRLFENINEAERDEICRQYAAFYREGGTRFPKEAREPEYETRMRSCYPFHPELFDRLYAEWSTLENFQRTRGVLQLMAAVIRRLWNDNNQSPFIQPGDIPFGDREVSDKCVRWLEEGWAAVIDTEVEGTHASTVRAIDSSNPEFGKIQAAQRMTRTIFLDSAPSAKRGAHQGVDKDRLCLGAAIPGQALARYEDVLTKLSDQCSYLYSDGNRYRYDKHPTLNKEVDNLKEKIPSDRVRAEIKKRVTDACGRDQMWSGIHVFAVPDDIPDDIGTGFRLVVLDLDNGYDREATTRVHVHSAAVRYVLWKGKDSRRFYPNKLIFLAPSMNMGRSVEEAAKKALAWEQVVDEIDGGRRNNLDGYQVKQAREEKRRASDSLNRSIRSCFVNLLAPIQGKQPDEYDFEYNKINDSATGALAVQAANTLRDAEVLIPNWGAVLLKNHLSEKYFKNGAAEAGIKKVWEDLSRCLNFPRVQNQHVFENAVQEGVKAGIFGYAQGKSGDSYDVFSFRQHIGNLMIDSNALLIEKSAAEAYLAKLNAASSASASQPGLDPQPNPPAHHPVSHSAAPHSGEQPAPGAMPAPEPLKTRFFATLPLNSTGGLHQLKNIWDEIVSNLNLSPGCTVEINLDISVSCSSGFDSNTVRSVKENLKALGYGDEGTFE